MLDEDAIENSGNPFGFDGFSSGLMGASSSGFNDFVIECDGMSSRGWISVPSFIGDKNVPSLVRGFRLCINLELDFVITLR